jgi:hypothetical protein
MEQKIRELQLGMALAGLMRIAHKRAGFTHTEPEFITEEGFPYNPCDCPQCIAKDILEQIRDLEKTT